jgi:hypothetical protein
MTKAKFGALEGNFLKKGSPEWIEQMKNVEEYKKQVQARIKQLQSQT